MQLPVGYIHFHKDAFINYQLNRWYSLGYARKQDVEEVGANTKSFADYVAGFTRLAEEAEGQKRLRNAAFYYRAAEFLVEPADARKLSMYEKFNKLFYLGFEDEGIEQHTIPYAGSHLPAMRLTSRRGQKRGTILACGGFDSFIEEFYSLWAYFADAGYEVIAFEGPGQGAALRRYGLPFDHDWEKPTKAILDHFDIQAATMIGVSMGGYWCLRAAAFEKRISQVIAFPPVYDWMELAGSFNRGLVDWLIKRRSVMNFLIRLKMTNGKLRHTVNQALFLTQKDEPIDAVEWMLAMNKAHLHSELVTQDVLLLGGEHDAFQPPKLLKKQERALINARSVTTRIFTQAENADQHCQIGNLDLALDTMQTWISETPVLRPATLADVAFLADVVITATLAQGRFRQDVDIAAYRAGYEEWTRETVQGAIPDCTLSVIELDGRPIGRLRVLRTETAITLAGIQLLPDFQNRRIGSRLIEQLKREAECTHLPLRISVEKDNPNAQRLYERMECHIVDQDAREIHLEYHPASRA